jgi:ABC-2 type transport system ATP-binding protein
MTDAIKVRGLTRSFGRTEVLRGLDFTVPSGTVFALLGPNGAGKTTTINILTTLVKQDGGTALIDGIDVARRPEDVKRRISLTGQSAAVDEILTGDENLRMMGRLSGLGNRTAAERSAELLERFDLSAAARRRVSTYSGGMRRRLDLAISLILPPSVMFLDEPTTGLDTRSRQAMWGVIRDLAESGTTVFLTTQYLEEADRLADSIAVLSEGRIVATGTAAELKSSIGGESVELHDADGELLREIPTDGTVHGLRRAVDELDALELEGTVTLRRPSLEDVFLALTASAGPTAAGRRPADLAPMKG